MSASSLAPLSLLIYLAPRPILPHLYPYRLSVPQSKKLDSSFQLTLPSTKIPS